MNDTLTPTQWLKNEDKVCYSDRLRRLCWLKETYGELGGFFMLGGRVSHYLFEEARYCFAYGQFIGAIMLGVAFIERELAAKFRMSGNDKYVRSDVNSGHQTFHAAKSPA